MNIKQAKEDLRAYHDVLVSNGLRPMLLFGTLLGYYREGGFIRHDTDIDIGLRIEDREGFTAILERGEFSKAGLNLLRNWEGLISLQRNTNADNPYDKLYIDTYFFKPTEDGYINKIITDEGECTAIFKMTKREIEKIKNIVFYNRSFIVPKDTRSYLIRHYGRDFMTPIKNKHSNPFMNE